MFSRNLERSCSMLVGLVQTKRKNTRWPDWKWYIFLHTLDQRQFCVLFNIQEITCCAQGNRWRDEEKNLFRFNICESLEIKNVYNIGVRVHFSLDPRVLRLHRLNSKFLKFNFCLFEAASSIRNHKMWTFKVNTPREVIKTNGFVEVKF